MQPAGTKADPSLDDTLLADDVIRLRIWGSDRTFPLPTPDDGRLTIGASDGVWLRLHDRDGRVSRLHAELVHERGKWVVRDLRSTNGIKVGRVRRDEIVLEPGLEIWIGGVTLVAESGRSAALRGFLGRVLGWAPERADAVDLALRAVRMTAAHRAPLVLCGRDDLVSVARALHRRLLGADRPFVVCDPRRKRAEENVRSAENCGDARTALRAATRGSLCVWHHRLPRDFDVVKRALHDPDARVHLVVCAADADAAEAFGVAPITIPELASRQAEIDRVIHEYAGDALAELGASAACFTPADHAWVKAHETASLPQIEKATARLVAIRQCEGNLSRAAARLGMARMSLYKWLGRRKPPMHLHTTDR